MLTGKPKIFSVLLEIIKSLYMANKLFRYSINLPHSCLDDVSSSQELKTPISSATATPMVSPGWFASNFFGVCPIYLDCCFRIFYLCHPISFFYFVESNPSFCILSIKFLYIFFLTSTGTVNGLLDGAKKSIGIHWTNVIESFKI